MLQPASELVSFINSGISILPFSVEVISMDAVCYDVTFRLFFKRIGIHHKYTVSLESLTLYNDVRFPWGYAPIYVSEWQGRMVSAAFPIHEQVIAAAIWYWLNAYIFMTACEVSDDAFRLQKEVFREMWTLNVKKGRSLYDEFLLVSEASIKNIIKPADAKVMALAQLL